MSFTPNFSVSQTTIAQDFTITDSSVGSDGSISARRVYLQLSDGTYLNYSGATTDYILFPLSDGSSIDIIGLLQVDYAISITVQWLNSGNTVLYTKTLSFCFTENDEQFMYGLCQAVSANQSILQDTNFVMNCFSLSMLVDYAQKAVETGNDITGSQNLLDLAQNYVNNESMYF